MRRAQRAARNSAPSAEVALTTVTAPPPIASTPITVRGTDTDVEAVAANRSAASGDVRAERYAGMTLASRVVRTPTPTATPIVVLLIRIPSVFRSSPALSMIAFNPSASA